MERVVGNLLIWETCEDSVAQRVHCGKVKMQLGLRTKAFHCWQQCATCHRGDLVTRLSLFLEDWELPRVSLSCHISLDMLCQQMHEA